MKPIGVGSYVGRGGGKAAAALKDIWQGLRGGEIVGGVELGIGESMELAQAKGELKDGQGEIWEKDGKADGVVKAFAQLVGVLESKKNL